MPGTGSKAVMAHALTALLVFIIAVLTLVPQASGPMGIPGFDKLAHLVAFAVVTVPLAWRFPHLWRGVALAALAYGGIIEIVQPFMGRTTSWGDLLADGAGAFAGAFIASRIGKQWRGRADLAQPNNR